MLTATNSAPHRWTPLSEDPAIALAVLPVATGLTPCSARQQGT